MSPFATLRRLKRGPITPGLTMALGAGAALHIAGLALIGATWRMPAPPPEPETFVRAERADSALNEQADLLDPSPLFLPTQHNHGAGRLRIATNADTPPLAPIARHMSPADGAPLRRPAAYAALTEAYAKRTPEEQLPKNSGDTFLTYGRTPPAIEALKPTGARCTLRDEATGRRLGETELPPVETTGATARPAVFFVESDAYGVSPPLLRESSGDPALDKRLAEAVAATLAKHPPKAARLLVTAVP